VGIVKHLEALAIELARLLSVEVRRERARLRPADERAAELELDAMAPRVRSAIRRALPLLSADEVRAFGSLIHGRVSRAAICDALAAAGSALSRPGVQDDGPPTPRDLDDTATEGS
jgi:hypothetical protein